MYTPLHLVPPSVPGLISSIENKYKINASNIRFLYRYYLKKIPNVYRNSTLYHSVFLHVTIELNCFHPGKTGTVSSRR